MLNARSASQRVRCCSHWNSQWRKPHKSTGCCLEVQYRRDQINKCTYTKRSNQYRKLWAGNTPRFNYSSSTHFLHLPQKVKVTPSRPVKAPSSPPFSRRANSIAASHPYSARRLLVILRQPRVSRCEDLPPHLAQPEQRAASSSSTEGTTLPGILIGELRRGLRPRGIPGNVVAVSLFRTLLSCGAA